MFLMPSSDPTFGRRDLTAVQMAAYSGDRTKLAQALTADVTDGDDRSYRVAMAVKSLQSRRQRARVAQWAAEEPASATAALLHGALEVNRAWDVRGGALAKDTRPARLAGFVEILQQAEHWCRTAAKLDPTDPTPCQWLLIMAKGQQVPPTETLARRNRLVALSPEHFMGHFSAVGSLSPMWGYPRDLMYGQVRAWTSTAPAGSLLPALIFVAHLERWLRGRVVRDDFLDDPEVRAEAEAATERMRMEPCRQPAEYWAHNCAAGLVQHDQGPQAGEGALRAAEQPPNPMALGGLLPIARPHLQKPPARRTLLLLIPLPPPGPHRLSHPRRLVFWSTSDHDMLLGMILEVALIDVVPGQEDAFAAAYQAGHPILAGTPGCRSVRMTRGIESASRFVLLVEWDNVEAHEKNFRGTERFDQWRALIGAYFAKPPLVEHFTDVEAVPR